MRETAKRSFSILLRKRPPDMKSSCGYDEERASNRQELKLQLGGCALGLLFTAKTNYIPEHLIFICILFHDAVSVSHGLRVLENRVLRRIFGPKRDEVTGGWRKLHNEKLHGCTLRPVLLG
jgi:hypothetical protein